MNEMVTSRRYLMTGAAAVPPGVIGGATGGDDLLRDLGRRLDAAWSPASMQCIQVTKTVKRTLITGAAGFVGANLARRLLAEGHDVYLAISPNSDSWRIDALETALAVRARGRAIAADLEIFLDRHAGKESPALGHEGDALAADLVGGERAKIDAA